MNGAALDDIRAASCPANLQGGFSLPNRVCYLWSLWVLVHMASYLIGWCSRSSARMDSGQHHRLWVPEGHPKDFFKGSLPIAA